jgi:DNA topoisomerase VI subunit A
MEIEEAAYRWEDAILDIITEKWNIGETFTIRDLYFEEKRLSYSFPKNQHVRERIRATMQFLRDAKYIEFIDNRGTYRRVK